MVYHLPSLKESPYLMNLMPSDPRPLVEVLGFLPMAEAQPEQPENTTLDKTPDLQTKTDLK